MGGIAAYLLINQQRLFLKIFTHKITEISSWGIILLIALNKFHLFSIIDHEIVTVATLVIIINQVSNTNKIVSLENRVLIIWEDFLWPVYLQSFNYLLCFCPIK